MTKNKLNIKIFRDIEQRTDAWMQIKSGKTSGSGVKPILSARTPAPWKTYAYKLISQRENEALATYRDGYLSEAVQWGQDMEPEAIKEFEKRTGKIVEQVGWVESLDPALKGKSGCSPDGIITIKEWVEIKCLSTENHIKFVTENSLPTDFKPQVINYFVINPDLDVVYLALYDPRVKIVKKKLHIIPVFRKDCQKDIDALSANMLKFHDLTDELHQQFLSTPDYNE